MCVFVCVYVRRRRKQNVFVTEKVENFACSPGSRTVVYTGLCLLLQDDFGGDSGDLYDDVIVPSGDRNNAGRGPSMDRGDGVDTNGSYHHHPGAWSLSHIPRRHQLYVGNLPWWTTDQDITDSVADVGVNDFQEVKFFENRANGQSKGFCVISLGSENSMRLVMERLPKKELHGQNPVVTLPTKQALNQFESQQKTRPTPPAPGQSNGPRPPVPGMPMGGPGGPGGGHGGPGMGGPGGPPGGGPGGPGGPGGMGGPGGPQPRMMNPNMPPGMRPPHPHMSGPMHMQGPHGGPGGPPRPQVSVGPAAPPHLVRSVSFIRHDTIFRRDRQCIKGMDHRSNRLDSRIKTNGMVRHE